MADYQHGGDIYGRDQIRLDFSVNTNPYGMPEPIRSAVISSQADWERYPDAKMRCLREALAAYYGAGWRPEHFFCGNGSSDLLFSLCFALRPRWGLVLAPSFLEYERALRASGCLPERFFLKEEELFSAGSAWERLILAVRSSSSPGGTQDRPGMVILGNPNNPTGQAVPAQLLARLADACREAGCILVVDECFGWFLEAEEETSLFPMAAREPERFSHVILLNAFTKIFSMAGLRLGYAACTDPDMADRVEAVRQPWSVSAPAQAAGLAALRERDFVSRTKALVAEERRWMAGQLAGLGMRVYPSETNYLLFKKEQEQGGERRSDSPTAGKERSGVLAAEEGTLADACRKRGILIRSCANFSGLDGRFYRIAVRRRQENLELLECLRELCGG